MNQFPSWLIEGIPFGCVYGLIAVGIVLTYKTTGVFNFAFAAQAFIAGAFYVELVEVNKDFWLFHHALGGHRWLGLVIAVLVVSPLVGLLLDRVLFRAMRTAPWQVKLVSVLGLFVALPEITRDLLTGRSPVPVTVKSSIPPMLGINAAGFNIGSHFVAWDFMMAAIITVLVVIGLGLIFRYTAIGLQMRAVVESPRMVELAGVDSERVSAVSWMLSSVLAGLAGVILATLAQTLDVTVFTILVIVTIAAAVCGRLQSIPITFAAGVLLGVGERALPDILQSWFGVSSSGELAKDLRPTLPFLILFLVLVLVKSIRSRRESADPLSGVDPPPPAMASTYKTPEIERLTRIAFPVFIVGFLVVMLTLVSGLWVYRISDGLTLAVAFLSITIITGFAGQISLAQATFAGLGGFAAADLATGRGIPIVSQIFPSFLSGVHLPILLGVAIGAVVAAAIGALFALPALRLGGIYLTLATLAFGLMIEDVIFNRPEVSNAAQGIRVPRPSFANTDRTFFLLAFAVFAVVGFGVILIRKGTTGRFFMAVRGSETAAASIGINATAMRITLFALSAAVAGIGGGLIAMHGNDVRVGDAPTFPTIIGIAWVVLVVTLGSRTVDGAVNAGISFVVIQWLLQDALHLEPGIFLILFGLGAITYARHPEGIVEYQTRKSILEMARAHALAVRAQTLRAAGKLPPSYTRVARVVVPVAAGPVLYFVYLLVRSATQLHAAFGSPAPFVRLSGHWATVHSPTLLAFILPSVAYLLVWMVWADDRLRRQGARPGGPLLMLAGAGAGAGLGALLQSSGSLPGSGLDATLVGIPAGAAFAMFLWLPVQVQVVARGRGWLESPLTWRDGRIPAIAILIGTYLYTRATNSQPPNGWPVFLVGAVLTILWLQTVASFQGAFNELAIGSEGETRRLAERLGEAPDEVDVPAAALRVDRGERVSATRVEATRGEPGARPALLDRRGVCKRFSGITALDDVCLDVLPGEMVGLIGPNGAGKTTFFNCLLGMTRPESGSVLFDGHDITGLPVHKRARLGFGRTFQRLELFSGMTVREHFLVTERARRGTGRLWKDLLNLAKPTADEQELAARMIDLTGLQAEADKPVESLSLGRGRLVELGRALMTQPKLLLLDEPSSGLDVKETASLADKLAAVQAEHEFAVLLVEHDVEMVSSLVTRLYVLDFGELIASGPTADVLGDEAVRKAYLGDMP